MKILLDNAPIQLLRALNDSQPSGAPVDVVCAGHDYVVLPKEIFDNLQQRIEDLEDAADAKLIPAILAEKDFMPYEEFRKELGLD